MKTGGAVSQTMMRTHPARDERGQFYFPLRGIINRVHPKDETENDAKQTTVDIELLDGYPQLFRVPIVHNYITHDQGEDETPELGAIVLVQFIDGNFNNPVVLGYLSPPDSAVLPDGAEFTRSHRTRNGTWETIDKDGNRITTVEKNETRHVKIDETLTIDGKRTTIIEGNETVTINSGDISITATAGKCTVNIKGKTAWRSDETIELDGTAGTGVKGIVQGDCICPITRLPHVNISASVKGSK